MKTTRLIITLALCAICIYSVNAEQITLHTGRTINGTILMQNEEIVLIQDANGRRYQYRRTDIESIKDELPNKPEPTSQETGSTSDSRTNVSTDHSSSISQSQQPSSGKKTSFMIELIGGGSFVPNEQNGGIAGGNILIGTRSLLGRSIFLGGGLGYQAHIIGSTTYSILPIVVAARIPIIEGKHAPMAGLSVGYGVGLSSSYLGGMNGSIDFGYLHTGSTGRGIYVGAVAQFQQLTIQRTETITSDNTSYEYKEKTGRSFFSVGLKIAFRM